jgi:hypothetical protein
MTTTFHELVEVIEMRNPIYLDTESDFIWTPERGNSHLPFGVKEVSSLAHFGLNFSH